MNKCLKQVGQRHETGYEKCIKMQEQVSKQVGTHVGKKARKMQERSRTNVGKCRNTVGQTCRKTCMTKT